MISSKLYESLIDLETRGKILNHCIAKNLQGEEESNQENSPIEDKVIQNGLIGHDNDKNSVRVEKVPRENLITNCDEKFITKEKTTAVKRVSKFKQKHGPSNLLEQPIPNTNLIISKDLINSPVVDHDEDTKNKECKNQSRILNHTLDAPLLQNIIQDSDSKNVKDDELERIETIISTEQLVHPVNTDELIKSNEDVELMQDLVNLPKRSLKSKAISKPKKKIEITSQHCSIYKEPLKDMEEKSDQQATDKKKKSYLANIIQKDIEKDESNDSIKSTIHLTDLLPSETPKRSKIIKKYESAETREHNVFDLPVSIKRPREKKVVNLIDEMDINSIK